MIAIPINLIITTLLLGLIIFLAYIFLNKLTKGSPNYIPPEDIENPQNPEENDHSNNNRNHNHNQRRNNNNINDFQNQEQNINPDSFKKLTKKEQIKMQKKQERKEQRDAMLLAMEEKKRREQEKQMQLLLKEKEKEEEAKRIEEEAKRIAEEKKKKEDEEYDKWRELIKVGEEGEDRMDFEKEETINKFLDYIKIRKVVSLEDISGTFKLNPNEIVEKLNKYENEGRIMGIIDDRGKYIYITEKEMGLIEKMLTNRGRISKTDLIKECNRLIRFEPTEQDKIKIAEEQEKTLKELEEELKVKK